MGQEEYQAGRNPDIAKERGLLVDEIAELLFLQRSSVMGYLVQPYRRADLFRRLFEETESVTSRARDIVARRRAGLIPERKQKKKPRILNGLRERMPFQSGHGQSQFDRGHTGNRPRRFPGRVWTASCLQRLSENIRYQNIRRRRGHPGLVDGAPFLGRGIDTRGFYARIRFHAQTQASRSRRPIIHRQ